MQVEDDNQVDPKPALGAEMVHNLAQQTEVGIEKVKNWWNSWACCLCTYFVSPVVLVGTFFGASASMTIVGVRNASEPSPFGTCDDLYIYSNVSQSWKVYLSLIPIYLVIWGVLLMNKGSQVVAPFALIVTSVLCLLYFSDEGLSSQADIVQSSGLVLLTVVDRLLWTVFEYAYNVFSAFLFLRVLQLWGIVGLMKDEFEVLAYSPERKILLIMFNFAIMIAVVAPGGSNFLIAGSILIDMNIMNLPLGYERDQVELRIGVLALFGNGLTSAFNLVGVCIIALAGDVIGIVDEHLANYPCAVGDEKCAQKQIGFHFSAQVFLLALLTPMWFSWIVMKRICNSHFLNRELILHLGCGLFYAFFQVITAYYIGPELPCLIAAGMGTVFYLVYVKGIEPWYDRKKNRRLSLADEEARIFEEKGLALSAIPWVKRLAWMNPFIVLTALLMITNLFPGVVWALQGGDDPVAQQALDVILLSVRTKCKMFSTRWPWLIHSGTMVLISALVTPLVCRFNSNEENIQLMELVDLNVGVTGGNNQKLGEEMEAPVRAKLERTKEMNRQAMSTFQKMARPELHFGFRYRTVMHRAFFDAANEALPVTIAIASFASLARIMSGFGMTKVLSSFIVSGIQNQPILFGLFSPVIGQLGAGLTGSTTTSNFLFGRLQVQTAFDLGIVKGLADINPLAGETRMGNIWAVCGLQVLGCTAGEIIAPQNAVFAAIILKGKFTEGAIIKGVLPISFFLWSILCMLTGLVALGAVNYG